MRRPMASLWRGILWSLEPCEPSRCPYCPGRPEPHWSLWGFYSRWAQNRKDKIRVRRYRCPFVKRTFSLLPDGLLPYQHFRTSVILGTLEALFIRRFPPVRCALACKLNRSTVRDLRLRFQFIAQRLRLLPGQEGALKPKALLIRLLRFGIDGVAAIFRDGKETEPKLSVVGVYRR